MDETNPDGSNVPIEAAVPQIDAEETAQTSSAVQHVNIAGEISNPKPAVVIPNLVIFGETGTGKSSVINMIAGSDIAKSSSDAVGCTFASTPYTITLENGEDVRIWDTAGLNEGNRGSVSAQTSTQNLHGLVRDLDGQINLLIYCIRGMRIREIVEVNYQLFYKMIFEEKVPIVLVATGLEHEEPMEGWWEANWVELEGRGLKFDGHACITATKGKIMASGGFMYDDEYQLSAITVRNLISTSYSRLGWSFDAVDRMSSIIRQFANVSPPQRDAERRRKGAVLVQRQQIGQNLELGQGVSRILFHFIQDMFQWIPAVFRLLALAEPIAPNGPSPTSAPPSRHTRRTAGK